MAFSGFTTLFQYKISFNFSSYYSFSHWCSIFCSDTTPAWISSPCGVCRGSAAHEDVQQSWYQACPALPSILPWSFTFLFTLAHAFLLFLLLYVLLSILQHNALATLPVQTRALRSLDLVIFLCFQHINCTLEVGQLKNVSVADPFQTRRITIPSIKHNLLCFQLFSQILSTLFNFPGTKTLQKSSWTEAVTYLWISRTLLFTLVIVIVPAHRHWAESVPHTHAALLVLITTQTERNH